MQRGQSNCPWPVLHLPGFPKTKGTKFKDALIHFTRLTLVEMTGGRVSSGSWPSAPELYLLQISSHSPQCILIMTSGSLVSDKPFRIFKSHHRNWKQNCSAESWGVLPSSYGIASICSWQDLTKRSGPADGLPLYRSFCVRAWCFAFESPAHFGMAMQQECRWHWCCYELEKVFNKTC